MKILIKTKASLLSARSGASKMVKGGRFIAIQFIGLTLIPIGITVDEVVVWTSWGIYLMVSGMLLDNLVKKGRK